MYSGETELFETELIIHIKVDLTLINLKRLICHKTQQTNQPTNTSYIFNIYLYKYNLALNNQQVLICHKVVVLRKKNSMLVFWVGKMIVSDIVYTDNIFLLLF